MNKRHTAIIALVSALLLPACRSVVLEDRTECPSFIFFKIGNADQFASYDAVHMSIYRYPDGLPLGKDTTSVQEVNNRDFYFDIRKAAAVQGCGVLGFQRCVSSDGKVWSVPIGDQFDSLFCSSYRTEVKAESFLVPLEFFKEYCKVTVQFTGIESFINADGVFPFDLTIRGNTCGIDALSGVPVRGPFEYRPKELEMGKFRFLLPRQADQDLKMELYGRKGALDREGHVETFDRWALLREKGGISWTEPDLPDVYMEIDYQESTVNVFVSPWGNQSIHYEF